MAAAWSRRPEEDRMAAAGSRRPEEDRMAAAGPGRLPSRGEDDRERLRMIADLGEDPGIEQLLEQSRVPEEIFIRSASFVLIAHFFSEKQCILSRRRKL
jgi:hypothetical protein